MTAKEFLLQKFPETKIDQWKRTTRKPMGFTTLHGFENTATSETIFLFEVGGKFALTNDVSSLKPSKPRLF